jgi:hypothetical protein
VIVEHVSGNVRRRMHPERGILVAYEGGVTANTISTQLMMMSR